MSDTNEPRAYLVTASGELVETTACGWEPIGEIADIVADAHQLATAREELAALRGKLGDRDAEIRELQTLLREAYAGRQVAA
jgi:hypothetical protein